MTFQLAQLDAVEWLNSLPAASVDLVVTDIAYESLEKWRAVGTTTRLKKDWFDIFPNVRIPELLAAFYRVMKDDTHLYLYSDVETTWVFKPALEAAGFKFWKPLVWDKKKIGMGYHYRNRYEFILFAEKGKRKLNNFSISDVIEVPRINNGYPTEKPVEVSTILIEQSTQPGQVVIDPFCGSGSVGVAAIKAGRNFWGNDLAASAVDLARQRLIELTDKCGAIV